MRRNNVNAASWDATVKKMINALKAPIDDAKAITDYLAKNYGT